MIEFVGWLGAILFALCGAPQAYKSYIDKHSHGLSWGFLGMWLAGEVCVLFYVAMTTMDTILIANYVANLLILYVILYFKIKPECLDNTV